MLLGLAVWQLAGVLLLLVWGGLLAYLVSPLVSRLEHLGLRRVPAAVAVFLGIGLLLLVLVTLGGPIFLREAGNLVRLLPGHLHTLAVHVGRLEARFTQSLPPRLRQQLNAALLQYERSLGSALLASLRHLWTAIPGVVSLFLGPLVAFYLVKDSHRLRALFFSLWPPEEGPELEDLLWRLDQSLGGFLRGQLLVAMAVGLLAACTAFVFHLGFGLFIGVVAGVTEVIPYVGPIVGALPAVAVASFHGTSTVLWVILAFVAIHQIEGGLLSPLIVGQEMGLSPLTVLLALFIGGEVGGIVGLVLAVPATGALGTLGRWLFERFVDPLPAVDPVLPKPEG